MINNKPNNLGLHKGIRGEGTWGYIGIVKTIVAGLIQRIEWESSDKFLAI